MNTDNFFLIFNIRKKTGKKNNLILRKNSIIPSIIYNKKESIPVSFEKKNLIQISKIISNGKKTIKCKIEEKESTIIIKNFQKHPYKNEILHFDFQIIEENEKIKLDVDFKFSEEKLCPGIKQGGFLIKHMTSVQIKSIASEIPNYINVDLSNLNLNETIFLSDLKLEKNIIFPILYKKKSSNLLVASIIGSRTDVSKETQKK